MTEPAVGSDFEEGDVTDAIGARVCGLDADFACGDTLRGRDDNGYDDPCSKVGSGLAHVGVGIVGGDMDW